MVFFPSHDIELFLEEENEAVCGLDNFDNPKKCLVSKGIVRGDFQPMNPSEVAKEFGYMVQGMYRAYLDYDVEINHLYKVKVEGFEGYFQVQGEPIRRNLMIPHTKVTLQREGLQ